MTKGPAPPELQGSYEAIPEATQAHSNCRFWLLDLRGRPAADPDLNVWFLPRIAAALNGPLFTAYLAGPYQRPAAERG